MSLLLAALIDWFWGEPPNRLHPVAWVGRYLSRVGRGLPLFPRNRAFIAGVLRWTIGAVIFTCFFAVAEWGLAQLPAWAAVLGTALLLKPLFAFRMLLTEVSAVEAALQESVDAGRRRLSHIVSRDTTHLTEAEVRESALESLSENLSDSVVAPLFWFAVLGLPGAALYRFSNTADAMWGYRGEWEWAGKWAARFDDIMNYVPARATAGVLMLCGGPGAPSLAVLAREAARTSSPNSGWPMAAFALRLGIRLGKPGAYTLNALCRPPQAGDVARGLRLAMRAGALAVAALAIVRGLLEWRMFHA